MSTLIGPNELIGQRLRSERKRIGLDQDGFAEIGGVKRRALSNYENGARSPDAEFLSAIAVTGVDLQYILTGIRSDNLEAAMAALGGEGEAPPSVPNGAEVKRLLECWGRLPEGIRTRMVALIEALTAGKP